MKKQKKFQIKDLENSNTKRLARIMLLMLMTVVSLTACSLPAAVTDNAQGSIISDDTSSQERVDTGFVLTGPDSYDSADTPVVVDVDEEENTITFLNLEIGRRYTLSMDGTTKLYDKYGESISLSQINKGDIVDITFLKSKKHLTTMQLSPTAWSYHNVERYEIDTVRQEVTIGQEVYKLSNHIQYLSDGRSIEEMDLNAADILTFQGIDKEILCINVEKGHGYLRLTNDENFIGGWIEIGQSLIKQITEDMLLTVPEGSYQVNISYNGSGGTKSVVIHRNEETTLDIGDLEIAEPKYGTILFSVTPSGAQIYIDGEEIDASQPVLLEYGIHQLIAKADGYQSITRYLRVGEESAGIDVVLDSVETDDDDRTDNGNTNNDKTDNDNADDNKTNNNNDSSDTEDDNNTNKGSDSDNSDNAEDETQDNSSTGGSSEQDAVTDYDKIYIDAPEGVEVYLNGNYVGITPCSFRKEEGTHVITLRADGYETKSYTIYIDDEEKDFSYSFANLEEVTEYAE